MILQIGVSGFTASRLWKKIQQAYPESIGLSRQKLSGNVHQGGLEKVSDLLRGVDTIIYTPSPYLGQIPKLIELLESLQYKGFLVVFSTAAIHTSIPIQKRSWVESAEQAALSASFCVAVVRPNLIYGYPGDRNYERIIRWVGRLPLIPLLDGGKNLIQPVHVDDLVDAVLAIVDQKIKGIIELGGPQATSFRDFIKILRKGEFLPGIFLYVPKKLALKVMQWKATFPYLDLRTRFVRMDQVERFTESRVLSNSLTAKLVRRPLIALDEGIEKEKRELKSGK